MADVENQSPQATGLNTAYIGSLPGILKIVEIVFLIVTLASGFSCCKGWFLYVAIVECIIAVVFFALYVFNVVAKYPQGNWAKRIIANSVMGAIFLILSLAMLANAAAVASRKYIVADSVYVTLVFGYLAVIVLIVDSVVHFKIVKSQ